MEILLFTGYGPNPMNERLKNIAKNDTLSLVEKRIEMAKEVKNHATAIDRVERNAVSKLSPEDLDKWFDESPDGFLCVHSGFYLMKYPYGWTNIPGSPSFVHMSIVDVDMSRKWTITTYDGAESIKYLDEWQCADEKYNYYIENEILG